jgi:hypothetical protein
MSGRPSWKRSVAHKINHPWEQSSDEEEEVRGGEVDRKPEKIDDGSGLIVNDKEMVDRAKEQARCYSVQVIYRKYYALMAKHAPDRYWANLPEQDKEACLRDMREMEEFEKMDAAIQQQKDDKHWGKKQWVFITVNPDPKCKLQAFVTTVLKRALTKKWITKAYAAFEQRGETQEEAGKGFHVHILLHRGGKSRSQMMKEFKSTFKGLCALGNPKTEGSILNLKAIDDRLVQSKVDYMLGRKTDVKMAKVQIDRWWRQQLGLQPVYEVGEVAELPSGSSESSSSEEDAEASEEAVDDLSREEVREDVPIAKTKVGRMSKTVEDVPLAKRESPLRSRSLDDEPGLRPVEVEEVRRVNDLIRRSIDGWSGGSKDELHGSEGAPEIYEVSMAKRGVPVEEIEPIEPNKAAIAAVRARPVRPVRVAKPSARGRPNRS